jgi:hypothetical protein
MRSIPRSRRKGLSKEQRRANQRRQARKAHANRLKLQGIDEQLPKQARSIFDSLASAFTRPTSARITLLALAAILTLGARTVSNVLRCLGPLAPGHPTSYHRALSRHRRGSWSRARCYVRAVITRFAAEGTIELAGDDTVTEHTGPKVHGKCCHRDPVRSTHSFTAYRWGHKWVVLALLVRFPFTARRWALPLLIALYQSDEENRKQGRRHKTPPQLLRQMLCLMLRWFPDRRFVCTADGNYAAHDLAGFASRHRRRLALVSKFYPNAHLVAPPKAYPGKGRPRVRGTKLPAPSEVVRRTTKRTTLDVSWYGGGRRRVEVVSDSACWYHRGEKLVPVLWVFVRDLTGTHRDEYFFTTDLDMTPKVLIETYTGRWNIETTFQEMRSYLGLQTTRGWSRNTVLRAAPFLFVLYTVVAWLYAELPARHARLRAVDWPGKRDVTFSDAISAVRRWLWVEWVFAIPGHRGAFSKLSGPFKEILLGRLAPAA